MSQSLEKTMVELLGLTGQQSVELSAAQLLAQVRSYISAPSDLVPVDLASSAWAAVNVDTGGSSLEGRGVSLDSGVNAGSSALRRLGGANTVTPGSRMDRIDWSQAIRLSCDIVPTAGVAGGFSLISLGKSAADGIGAPARSGIAVGILTDALTLTGYAHDGAALAAVNLGTLTAVRTYRMLAVSLGNGTVRFYLDGVLVGSTDDGPSALGGVDESYFQLEVTNGATAAQQALHVGALSIAAGAKVL